MFELSVVPGYEATEQRVAALDGGIQLTVSKESFESLLFKVYENEEVNSTVLPK